MGCGTGRSVRRVDEPSKAAKSCTVQDHTYRMDIGIAGGGPSELAAWLPVVFVPRATGSRSADADGRRSTNRPHRHRAGGRSRRPNGGRGGCGLAPCKPLITEWISDLRGRPVGTGGLVLGVPMTSGDGRRIAVSGDFVEGRPRIRGVPYRKAVGRHPPFAIAARAVLHGAKPWALNGHRLGRLTGGRQAGGLHGLGRRVPDALREGRAGDLRQTGRRDCSVGAGLKRWEQVSNQAGAEASLGRSSGPAGRVPFDPGHPRRGRSFARCKTFRLGGEWVWRSFAAGHGVKHLPFTIRPHRELAGCVRPMAFHRGRGGRGQALRERERDGRSLAPCKPLPAPWKSARRVVRLDQRPRCRGLQELQWGIRASSVQGALSTPATQSRTVQALMRPTPPRHRG